MIIRRFFIPLIEIGFCSFLFFTVNGQTCSNISPANNITNSYGAAIFGGGVSFCDFNNDGWDDLTFSSCMGDSVHFFLNNNGVFQKIPALVHNTFEVTQILWADYDNDGDKDLFLAANLNPNKLYENTGNLNLVDVTAASGIQTSATSTFSANWFDYNKDGYLDLYVTNYSPNPAGLNELYKNNGNGTFANIASLAGVEDPTKQPLASACLDYNNDSWPDIYNAQDKYTVNSLFQNNHNGSFTNVATVSNSNIALNAMSATIGDYDNNGYLDIYVTNTQAGNKLLKNKGDSTFIEVAVSTGTTFNSVGWGAQFLDYDLDMNQDLYVSGSRLPSQGNLSSAFYKNLGNGTFNLNTSAGFLGDTVHSYGNAIGDVNNDGFPDIAVCNLADPHQIWQSNSGNGTWIKIKLTGLLSNSDGIGSWIEVYVKGIKQVRYTICGQGYVSQNSFTEFFGLNNNSIVDSLFVKWPSGITDSYFSISSNQTLQLTESETHCSLSNPLVISTAIKKISCEGLSNAEIRTSVSGGVAPYNYLWNTVSINTSSSIGNIGSEFYSAVISDANSCAKKIIVFIDEIPATLIQSIITHPTSTGSSDGSIMLNPVDVIGQLKYEWSNGQTTSNLLQVPAGNYSVHMYNSTGCASMHSFQLID